MGYVTRIEHALSMCVFIFPKTGRRTEHMSRGSWDTQDDQISDSPSIGPGDAGECGGDLPAHLGQWRRRDGTSQQFSLLNLRSRGERYLLAIPSNTLIRDIDATAGVFRGGGRHPKNPFMRVNDWVLMFSRTRGPRSMCGTGRKDHW